MKIKDTRSTFFAFVAALVMMLAASMVMGCKPNVSTGTQTFKLTFSAGDNGTLKAMVDNKEITSGSPVQKGKTVVFTAAPAAGYRVKKWTGTDNPASTDKTAVLTVKENATVSVEFESTAVPVQKFNVTFTQPKLGSLKAQLDGLPFTGGEVEQGKVIVFAADIPDCCRITQWNGTDTPAHTNPLATLTVSASVTVSVDLEYNSIVDSSLLTINGNVLEKCDPAAEGVVEIPAGVTAIKDQAFKSCPYITGVLIPNSVTEIGKEAFYECERLTAISISKGVTSIGKSAFYNCKRLTAVDIPNSVTTIGESAFQYCSQLRSITLPKDLTAISGGMFAQCDALETIQLPESITNIGAGAFSGCRNLETITLPKRITEIKAYTFSDCRSLRTFNWGEAQVQTIGASAFQNCSLSDIVMPKTVKQIDEKAFESSRIESIKITGKSITMKKLIFFNCNRLKNLVILSQSCHFEFEHSEFEQYPKLFSYKRPKPNSFSGLDTYGSVPADLRVTVKFEGVRSTLGSQSDIPYNKITVDPTLE